MQCDEVLPFLSAMYDGEPVPPEAADHLARCARCREQMDEFAHTGAAVRAYAAHLLARPLPTRTWPTPHHPPTPARPMWWEKAKQTMAIPRIAFAAMLLVLLALGSRLALVEVRAHADGSVVLLTMTPAEGEPVSCALSTEDALRNNCSGLAQVNNGNFLYSITSLRKQEERVLLSVRYRVDGPGPDGISPEIEKALPETEVWFTPGDTLTLPNASHLAITGQWADHIPVGFGGNPLLDPKPNEIRLEEPLLIKNNRVVTQQIGSASVDAPGEGVALYAPGEGSFALSATEMPGAVEGTVRLNRVSFTSDGQAYEIVAGMPVTRAGRLWVVHHAGYRPQAGVENSFITAGPVSKLP